MGRARRQRGQQAAAAAAAHLRVQPVGMDLLSPLAATLALVNFLPCSLHVRAMRLQRWPRPRRCARCGRAACSGPAAAAWPRLPSAALPCGPATDLLGRLLGPRARHDVVGRIAGAGQVERQHGELRGGAACVQRAACSAHGCAGGLAGCVPQLLLRERACSRRRRRASERAPPAVRTQLLLPPPHHRRCQPLTLQEQDLVVGGDAQQRAQVGLRLGGDGHELLAAVAHLHHAHAGALVVDQVALRLLQHLAGRREACRQTVGNTFVLVHAALRCPCPLLLRGHAATAVLLGCREGRGRQHFAAARTSRGRLAGPALKLKMRPCGCCVGAAAALSTVAVATTRRLGRRGAARRGVAAPRAVPRRPARPCVRMVDCMAVCSCAGRGLVSVGARKRQKWEAVGAACSGGCSADQLLL